MVIVAANMKTDVFWNMTLCKFGRDIKQFLEKSVVSIFKVAKLYFILMMEAVGYSETLMHIYRTTRGYTEPVGVVETNRTVEIFGSDIGR